MLHLECRKSVLQGNLSQIQIFEGKSFVDSIPCQCPELVPQDPRVSSLGFKLTVVITFSML